MVKTTNSGSNISPFLAKCYEMVDDESTDLIISWSQSNESFVIWDMTEFCVLLSKYFKHQNFSSFMRQLNIYGFRKIDTDRWEFANEGFIKGQKHLLRSIKRRKHPPPGLVQQKCSEEKETVVETVDYSSLQKEVEVLTADKKVLMQEFMKLREHQETAQNKLIVLRERIQGMEKSQQQLLSFLVMVMQSPGFLAQLFQPTETNWRMAESGKIALREGSTVNGEAVSSGDGMIVRYQPQLNEALLPIHQLPPSSDSEPDLSFDSMKELFTDIDAMSLPPIDEIYRSPENHHGPIIVPELDLSMIEHFLLDSPIRESNEHTEECLDSEEMELESCLYGTTQLEESQPTQKYQALSAEDGISQNLDVLTEQMGHLSPGNNSSKGEMIF